MDQQTIIAGIEARAAAIGLTIGDLCRQAGVHPTTFSRWKLSERNPKPVGMTLASVAAVEKALAAVEASTLPAPAEAAA